MIYHKTQIFDQCASAVLDLIETAPADTPIIVDFDETLFLRNSTEEYLNSLQPRILGALLLSLLNYLKPWNWLLAPIRGYESRDWLRVVVATILFPWTPILWRWHAKQLAHSYSNAVLLDSIAKNSKVRVIVATQGFEFIVRPIVKHLPLPLSDVIACRFWRGAIDRHKGKHARVKAALEPNTFARAIAITDSTDDTPLLCSVATPCLVTWPNAAYVTAMSDVYIPFLYLERAKRPGKQYFLQSILADDLVTLILALSWLSLQPVIHAFSMLFLLFSFWCIYEAGYHENDRVAEKFEQKPVLSKTYHIYKNRIGLWQPWVYALLFAIPGIILLEFSSITIDGVGFGSRFSAILPSKTLTDIALWMGIIVVVRACFWVYNHLDKQTRSWIYPILQGSKYFSFLVVTSTNVIGAMLFVAQVVSRSIPYILYRQGVAWPEDLLWQVIRCFLFPFILMALALGSHDPYVLISWQVLVIVLWCVFRVRRILWKISRQMRPIWQERLVTAQDSHALNSDSNLHQ